MQSIGEIYDTFLMEKKQQYKKLCLLTGFLSYLSYLQ